MSARKVVVEMTEAEAEALHELAAAGRSTCLLDGPDTLGLSEAEARSGMRAMDKLRQADRLPASHRAVIFTPGQERALWTLADMTLAGEVDLSPSELAAGVEAHRKLRTDR